MCGFVGYWQAGGDKPIGVQDVARRMADTLRHRGPDDAGVWADPSVGLAVGHTRLAILDLSPAGHPPMVSASGRLVISFNGEIYNHLALRAELAASNRAPAWRGHSDTETLLAAIECWGIEPTLQRCVGMFAFALWDKANRTLTLARDRLGEKPLYYGWAGEGQNRAFLFGSELKALSAYPGFDAPVCRQALAQYLRFMYVPAPRSIYQGIYKLEPGCLLTITGTPPVAAPAQPLRPGDAHGTLSLRRWWALANVAEQGATHQQATEQQLLQSLEDTLAESVRLQSLADVPLGAFLSGGVDSSTIVALMQRQAREAGRAPVSTFTIGFDKAGFDEAPHARAVARHLGTDHHEMRVTAQMAQDVIPTLPWMYDEPFADSSQIPTHLVCRAARQQVTVALSGDAGDELFGGYNRYFWAPRIWNRLGALPAPLRHALGGMLSGVPVSAWNAVGFPFMGGQGGVARLGDKLHKLADRLQRVNNLDDLYRSLVSEWQDPAALVRGQNGEPVLEPASLLDDPLPRLGLEADPLPMMYNDAMTYLPDDILCKVDRAAMACSLETRVPFLDHRVVELAWRLPLHMKIRGTVGKWALRQVLYKHVPRELIERPKAGFAIPVGQWLRGPLRGWAESLLAENRLQSEGYLRPEPVRSAWAEHLSGKRDNTAKLWAVLMFQAWLGELHKAPSLAG
ncbi:MAG: asparagine synthase (glutamine-hydrolyzing) [Quisquiliibacterium sp.]